MKESDENAKYELFQRLNTGGANLSEQEVRNCVAIMLNPDFYELTNTLAQEPSFKNTTAQTDNAIEKQSNVELVVRFFAFRNHPYVPGLDVHEYLDEALIKLASTKNEIDWDAEKLCFHKTFEILNGVFGANAFKRWDGNEFKGKFLMSLFETVAYGVSENLADIDNMNQAEVSEFLVDTTKGLWDDYEFTSNSGAGVRGTTRLSRLLPMAKEKFKP